jgi:hypothetical protein
LGGAIPKARVHVLQHLSKDETEKLTDETGNAILELQPGRFDLTVTGPRGFLTSVITDADVQRGEHRRVNVVLKVATSDCCIDFVDPIERIELEHVKSGDLEEPTKRSPREQTDFGSDSATLTSVAELSKAPRKFDGRLVRVRALLEFGWEGDNFLSDPSAPASRNTPSRRPVSVWFYCKPDHERQVFGAISAGDRRVLGTFTGYFHFVPDKKSRTKDVFDPGPLQLEAIGVSDLSLPDNR